MPTPNDHDTAERARGQIADEASSPPAREALEPFVRIPPGHRLNSVEHGHRAAFAIVAGDGLAPDLYRGNSVTVDLDRRPRDGELAAYRPAAGRPVVARHRGGRPEGAAALGVVRAIGWDPQTPCPAARPL
jgi:hypothetical protein